MRLPRLSGKPLDDEGMGRVDTNSGLVQAVRWVSAILLVAASLFLLNSAAFHWWASGGPPSPNPEWHRAWGNRFFAMSAALVFLAVLIVWRLRRREYERPT